MFKIRETKNRKLIEKLNERIFPEDPLEVGPTDPCWIVYLADMPVGFGTLRPLPYEAESVFFSRAGLQEIARGAGLHKRLIGVRLSWCKRNGYKNIITYTLQENLASANNLASMGFKLYEPENLWADSEGKREVLYFYREI